jgi:4-hydroxythreonine-4-phosphate dehydrogenase
MGDPAGVGPEVAAKALALPEIYEISAPLVVGDAKSMERAIGIVRANLKVRPVKSVREAIFTYGTMDVYDLDNVDMSKLEHKKVSAMAGRASFEYIERAIKLALDKEIDATTTGPIHKEAINAAGVGYPGHTEIYAALTGSKSYAMMLAHGNFRAVHVSTHVSLRKAIDMVKKDRVLATIKLAHEGLLRLGIARPRVAVAGLNPHSGEGGLFGDEEIKEIMPAIREAKALGIEADGPVPPDTVYAKAKGGQYDVVVAMYHDQGHIPMKLSGFKWDEKEKKWETISGVNITLGLPIIRTSVEHGVAFDVAGEGKANPDSMVEAVKVAASLASTQRDYS